jgi:hypothetical protein
VSWCMRSNEATKMVSQMNAKGWTVQIAGVTI